MKDAARTALITTAGFRDVLELRRLRVPQLYNLQWDKPRPLAPSYLRLEVEERIAHDGEVVCPLDETDFRGRIEFLSRQDIDSIAVCLLNAHANPAHEQQIGEMLATHLPDIPVSLSTDIIRDIGEYERTSTAVTNAYVKPVVNRYLGALQRELGNREFEGRLLVMQSNGAVMTVEAARRRPCYLIESGPAAGVVAGRTLVEALRCENAITLDMGGTTAKAAMVEKGEIAFVDEYEIGGGFTVGSRLMKGDGYLLRVPAIDPAEISAGGGSIAWIDSGGALQVGPQSAGAEPGPACYDLGSDEPTITDANVVLGYIDPDRFAGGSFSLKAELARSALQRLGNVLGMDAMETAYAVHVLGNARMARAIQAISTERGRDVRDFRLIAYGGSGPIHAAHVAETLGMNAVVVPPYPGLFSALGLIHAQAGHQFVRSYKARLDHLDEEQFVDTLREMTRGAAMELDELGYPTRDISYTFEADLRYVGQFFRVRIPIPDIEAENGALRARLAADFESEHHKRYGHHVEGEPIEIVSVQLTTKEEAGPVPGTEGAGAGASMAPPSTERTRNVYFSREDQEVETAVISRTALSQPRRGPLLIEEYDTTIVIPPGAQATLDDGGNVMIALRG